MKDLITNELKKIERCETGALLEFLNSSDFFTAPASGSPAAGKPERHGCEPGGLAKHSWGVYQELLKIAERFHLDYSRESLLIAGLFHDLCKVDFYNTQYRNVKDDAGCWSKQPYVAINDQFPIGHGEKSVIILQRFIPLNRDEILAIRWHMGPWDAEGYAGKTQLNQAISECKLLRALMLADMTSTWMLEKK